MPDTRQTTTGILYGLGCYLWWGLCPLYFKSVAHVPAGEVLAQRIVWSLVLLLLLLARRGDLTAALAQARQPRIFLTLTVTTLLVAVNWFTFIWAVSHDLLLQASLGYFINPLVNVLLGLVILRERLRPLQWVSLGLATIGVMIMGLRLGGLPMISLVLAFSFGFYGLMRKMTAVGGVRGLTIETGILTPVALGVMLFWQGKGELVFGHLDRSTDLLLMASGVVTAVPLIWFANAARRLRYSTVGFLQYLAPSLQFLLAVFVYHEPFARSELASFILIWSALGMFTLDAVARARRQTRPGE